MDIDANGILNVTAQDKATGREQRVVIEPTSGLSEQEVERLVREAEQHAAEDAKRREEVELQNRADSLAYSAERRLRDSGDQLPAEVRSELESQVQGLRQAMEGNDTAAILGSVLLRQAMERNDTAAIRSSMERLDQALRRADEASQAASSSTAEEAVNAAEASVGGSTVEGEFREV